MPQQSTNAWVLIRKSRPSNTAAAIELTVNKKLIGYIALEVDGTVAPLEHESLHGPGTFFGTASLLQGPAQQQEPAGKPTGASNQNQSLCAELGKESVFIHN